MTKLSVLTNVDRTFASAGIISVYWAHNWMWLNCWCWQMLTGHLPVQVSCQFIEHTTTKMNILQMLAWCLAERRYRQWCRCCFMLCITMEVEPRIVKQYKCPHCCSCKNYQEKVIFALIFGWPEDCEIMEKCVLGHPIARATSCCLLLDTFWLWASKNAIKVGV